MDSAAKLLLPGIDYFQVVFTMPAELSSLALGNRREMFDLLFRSAWRALKQVIEDEQQFEGRAADCRCELPLGGCDFRMARIRVAFSAV